MIESRIHSIRGHRVMVDMDLTKLYGVTTKRLNEQFRRNKGRFPNDFAFRLAARELKNLRSQIATSSWGGRRSLPLAGAVMLASVLNSPIAVRASIQVVRAFIRLRGFLAGHAELSRRLDELEQKYDSQFKGVFDAIRGLMEPPSESPQGRIGFHRE